MAYYDTYRDELASLYRGHALWVPDPSGLYDQIQVGDVGYVKEGHFLRMFNAVLPANDCTQVYGVPEGFVPLNMGPFNNIRTLNLFQGDYCSSTVAVDHDRLQAAGPEELEGTSASFKCSRGSKGAFLSLPLDGVRKDVIRTRGFEAYIRKHCDSWLDFAISHDHDVRLEDIILVTGCDLTSSWALAAFVYPLNPEISLSVRVSDAGIAKFQWTVTNQPHHNEPNQNVVKSHCVFLRGFRAKRILPFYKTLKAAAEPRPDDPDNEPESSIELLREPAMPDYRDPLIGILDYIAERYPKQELAIAHEDCLKMIKGVDTLTADAVENFLRQNDFPVRTENGVALLVGEAGEDTEGIHEEKLTFSAQANVRDEPLPLVMHPVLMEYFLKFDIASQSLDHDFGLSTEELLSSAVHPPVDILVLENEQGLPQNIKVLASDERSGNGVTVNDVLKTISLNLRKSSSSPEVATLDEDTRRKVEDTFKDRERSEAITSGLPRIDYLRGRNRLQVFPMHPYPEEDHEITQPSHFNRTSLDESYERVLKGILKPNRGHVRRLLQCLVVAIRPLRVDEAAAILTFDPSANEGEFSTLDGDSQLKSEEQEARVLSACPILITIVDDHNSRIVQFSHVSAKEFLTSERLSLSREDISCYHILPEAAHTTLAQVSLAVLLRLPDPVDRRNAMETPLTWYAARYWNYHAKFGSVSSRVMGPVKTLFDSKKPHFAAWLRIYDMDSPSCWSSRWQAQKPLYYSVLCGLYDLVEHLLEKNSRHINTIGGRHDFPLVAALHSGDFRIAELLYQRGADVDVQGTKDGFLLHRAVEWPDNLAVGAAQFLLTRGADIHARRTDLSTPLHLAADQGHLEVAQMLLQRGADINPRKIDGNIPLHLAAVRGHFEVAQMLLQRGADVNSRNVYGETPLQLMLRPRFPWNEGNRLNLVRLLLEYGVDVNSRNRTTALHHASLVPNLEVARVLLDHGANVNAEDDRGQTPLLWVLGNKEYFSKGQLHPGFDIAQLLVERGANVNIRDKDKDTPLHLASYFLKPELVRMLLDHGADVHAINSKEQTPLHRVSKPAHSSVEDSVDVVQLLVEHGAKANTQNKVQKASPNSRKSHTVKRGVAGWRF